MKVIHNENKYIDNVIDIINQAKAYFKEQGINQWQDGYPNVQSIEDDIKNNNSYVLIDNDKVVGTMFFNIGHDKTYDYIEDGHWLTNEDYAVIHRIVVDNQMKGKNTAAYLLEYAIKECKMYNIKSIRIDTHIDNLSMQRFLKKHDFVHCGTIYLESGDSRISFEKILS